MAVKTISIVDPEETKDQALKAIVSQALNILIANTAEVNTVVTSKFADEFIHSACEGYKNLWRNNTIVVKGICYEDSEGEIQDTKEYNKKSLSDMVELLNVIVKNNINIGDRVEFNYNGLKADGFTSKSTSGGIGISVAYVTDQKWGEKEDQWL